MTGLQRFKRLAAVTFATLLLWSSVTCAEKAAEYELKSAYIFNFLNFVDFQQKKSKTIVLCVIGQQLSEHFDPMAGQPIGEKTLKILYLEEKDSSFFCDALFVPAYASTNIGSYVSKEQPTSMLTIGETQGFAKEWGVVEFFLEDKSLRFRINVARAEASGLRFRASLLKRADLIENDRVEN